MDIDGELRQNMEDEKTSTITRTAVRVTLRTIAAQKAKSATNTGNDCIGKSSFFFKYLSS